MNTDTEDRVVVTRREGTGGKAKMGIRDWLETKCLVVCIL